MCDTCARAGDKSMDLILDYILLGLHLEVAIRMVRDSLTQNVMMQPVDDETSMHEIRYLSDLVEQQAEILRSMSNEDFRETLEMRAVLAVLL